MRELILFVFLKTLMCLNLSQGEVIYISPSPSCFINKTNLCLSLDELATYTSWFNSNTLIFLPGTHKLSIQLSIINISSLSLLTELSPEKSSLRSVVNCQWNASFYFYGVIHISASRLKLIGCRLYAVLVKQLLIKNITF